MKTADDRRSERRQVEPTLASSAEVGRLEAGPAWTAAWQVLNTPAGVVVSVVVAFGSVAALLLTVFLGQLNRMEDRLEGQIGELRDSNLAQIRELGDSMHATEQRLLAEINRRIGEIGEQ